MNKVGRSPAGAPSRFTKSGHVQADRGTWRVYIPGCGCLEVAGLEYYPVELASGVVSKLPHGGSYLRLKIAGRD